MNNYRTLYRKMIKPDPPVVKKNITHSHLMHQTT